jgi:hypothetical protein
MDRFEGSFADLIENIDKIKYDRTIYYNANKNPSEPEFIALDANDCEFGSDDYTPKEIEDRNFKELMNVADLQDVISNARQQKYELDIDDIKNAVRYFLKNDAFIKF